MEALIILIVIAADLLSKHIVQVTESLHNVVLIDGFFHITYAQNTGMAWSMLSGQIPFLSLVSAVAIGAMLYYLYVKKPDRLSRFALALMIGGAAGNLFDRMYFGYVRDFLDFYIFGYDFPIFNIADSALCIGVFLLAVAALKEEKKENGRTEMDR
ncbi:MAG: signal peptidase II [Erysipelotrichaceae bacterium]|nr:signal peptidase II [Erysipelotrichaceae bacterium]